MNLFLFPESMWILNRLHCSMIYSTCSPPFSSRWGLLYLLVRVKSCKIKKKLLILCILSKKQSTHWCGCKIVHLCTNRAYMPLLSIILCFFFSLFSPLPCHTLRFFFRFEESTDLIEKERGRKRKKSF